MKKTISISFFLLSALACAGQNAAVDTAYTELRWGYNPQSGDSAWYKRTIIVYENGVIDPNEILVGDTATAINDLFTDAEDVGRQFARIVEEVWNKKAKYTAPILQANNLLNATFDTSIIQISIDRYGPAQDSTIWDVYVDGVFLDTALLRILNDNNLRLEVAGGTNVNLRPVGDAWLAMINYPSAGLRTDLFRKRENGGRLEFRSLDWIENESGIRIVKKGIAYSRKLPRGMQSALAPTNEK